MAKTDRIAPLAILARERVHIADALDAADRLITSGAAYGLPTSDEPLLTYADIQRILPGKDNEWYRLITFFASLWRRYKQILDMDNALMEMLSLSDLPEIPAEDLRILPYPCFYVRLPAGCFNFSVNGKDTDLDGFFAANDVYTDTDGTKTPLIRFLLVSSDCNHVLHYSYLYNAGSIRQSSKCKLANIPYYMLRPADEDMPFLFRDDNTVLPFLLKTVLYIVSHGADIAERTKAAKDPSPKRGAPLKDSFAEITTWDVGVRVGAKWRKSQPSQTTHQKMSITARAPMRPHIRRGHYHHYWTGALSEPDKRKLIVKWQPPIMVTPSGDMPTTLRKL